MVRRRKFADKELETRTLIYKYHILRPLSRLQHLAAAIKCG
jgi:hypothetical protein